MKTFNDLKRLNFTGTMFFIFTIFDYYEGDTSGYDYTNVFGTEIEAVEFLNCIDFNYLEFDKKYDGDTIHYAIARGFFVEGELCRFEVGDFEKSYTI